MITYLNIAQIVVSVVLIIVLLLQTRGEAGGVFGAQASVFKSRRGVEKTLFQLAIVLAIIFLALSMLTVMLSGGSP